MSDVSLRCTLAGSSTEIFVSTGSLQLLQRGPWLARELVCSSATAPAMGSSATLVCKREDGSEDTFAGTVRRAVSNPGDDTLTLSLVGGAGGLLTALTPLDHVQGAAGVPAGAIARAICDAASETLAPGVELALDAVTLPRWHRATDTTAAVALDLLAWQLGITTGTPYFWRVLGSGQVWMGPETWAAVSAEGLGGYWTGIDAEDGATLYAIHGAPFLPGQAIDGLQVVEVWYTLGESGLDVRVRGALPGDPPHVPNLDLYRASYSATVVAQNDDGTIDVVADDARIGALRRLVFRVGIPGCSVTFDPTTTPPPRVRVRFDGASPSGAFAEGSDQDTGATAAAARVADLCGQLAFDATLPQLFYKSSDGIGWVPVALYIGPNTVGTPIVITTGSARTNLR